MIKVQSGDNTVQLLRNYTFLRFLFFFLLLFTILATSGQHKTFEECYNEVYHNMFSSGPHGALEVADSLYRIAKDDEQRMKSLMLIGTIQHGLGNISETMFQVTRAQEIAKKGNYKDWEARTTGFLANIYRVIGVTEEAKKGFEQADKLNESQKDLPSYFLTKANILQEQAHMAMYEELPALALDYLKEAQSYIAQNRHNPERATVVRTINLQLEAVCYLYLDKAIIADSIFRLANTILDTDNSMLLPYIYRGRAESALQHQQNDSAYHYLELAQPFVQSSKDLEMLLYGTYAKYYQSLGNHEQAMHYIEKRQKVSKIKQEKADAIIHEFILKMEEYNQSYHAKITTGWWGLVGIIIVLGGGLAIFWTKRHKEKATYLALIEGIESGTTFFPVTVSKEIDSVEKNSKSPHISKETESRLLINFEKAERGTFFLNKEMSLAGLAVILDTNSRYASYIVRKYRKMDFNSYLQHTRIHYIINRIRLEPELSDYKLSYLAELAGFPNHSKFSAVFKSVTGIPPSVFIHYTKEEPIKRKELVS